MSILNHDRDIRKLEHAIESLGSNFMKNEKRMHALQAEVKGLEEKISLFETLTKGVCSYIQDKDKVLEEESMEEEAHCDMLARRILKTAENGGAEGYEQTVREIANLLKQVRTQNKKNGTFDGEAT